MDLFCSPLLLFTSLYFLFQFFFRFLHRRSSLSSDEISVARSVCLVRGCAARFLSPRAPSSHTTISNASVHILFLFSFWSHSFSRSPSFCASGTKKGEVRTHAHAVTTTNTIELPIFGALCYTAGFAIALLDTHGLTHSLLAPLYIYIYLPLLHIVVSLPELASFPSLSIYSPSFSLGLGGGLSSTAYFISLSSFSFFVCVCVFFSCFRACCVDAPFFRILLRCFATP